MPIKNLTDDTLTERLPRLGKVRKGGERVNKTVTKNGKEQSVQTYGPDLDHFRFTSDDENIVAAFNAAFGAQPRELIIYLPYTDPDSNFSSWCELWSKSGLEHRCDGEYMSIWREGDKMRKGRKPCPGGHDQNDPRRDAVARLEFLVPQLLSAGYVGTVTLETHSLNDIVHIAGTLRGIANKRRGDLTGIAFRLWRQEEEISAPGFGAREGQRVKVKKWMVKIAPAAEWVRYELAQARANALDLSEAADVVTGVLVGGTRPAQIEAPRELNVRPALPAPQSVPLPDGAEWCKLCGQRPTVAGMPCEACQRLGAQPEAPRPVGAQKNTQRQASPQQPAPQLTLERARELVNAKGKKLGAMQPDEWQGLLDTHKPTHILYKAASLLIDDAQANVVLAESDPNASVPF